MIAKKYWTWPAVAIGSLLVVIGILVFAAPVPASWRKEWIRDDRVTLCRYLILLRPEYRWEVMTTACSEDRLAMVEMLLHEGLSVNGNSRDWPPLFRASGQKSLRVMELLLENGADVNIRLRDGTTPMFCPDPLDFQKFKAVLQLLLDHGADLNTQDAEGNTILHRWASLGRAQGVQYLLLLGADRTIKNNSGQLPVDTIPESNESKIMNMVACRRMLETGNPSINDLKPLGY